MSYKIVQPSTNSDRVGRFGVTSGTSDNVITFPNESGEIATTSDLPTGLPTTYFLNNTYTDSTTTDPQPITEWDIPVVAGKVYKLEYSFYGKIESGGTAFNPTIYWQTSSFTQPLIFAGEYSSGGLGDVIASGSYADMSTEFKGIIITDSNTLVASGWADVTFDCIETGTLRHLFRYEGYTTEPSSSLVAGKSYLKVTQLN